MKPDRFERLTRWGAGALMLLLAHGLCTPRSAWAGCNHLVVSKTERLLDINRLEVIGASASLSDETAREPMGDRGSKQRPAPCSGPGCSNRVPIPVPTGIHAHGGTDHWGALSVPVLLPASTPAGRIPPEPTPDSSGQEGFIFHPPRA